MPNGNGKLFGRQIEAKVLKLIQKKTILYIVEDTRVIPIKDSIVVRKSFFRNQAFQPQFVLRLPISG